MPMPLNGNSTDHFSYVSPAINVDANVNLSTLSMRVFGAVDDYYRSTGVINGSPLTLNQDSATKAFPLTAPGTNNFAAGATPMNSWRHGTNYIFSRIENFGSTYTVTSPTDWPH